MADPPNFTRGLRKCYLCETRSSPRLFLLVRCFTVAIGVNLLIKRPPAVDEHS